MLEIRAYCYVLLAEDVEPGIDEEYEEDDDDDDGAEPTSCRFVLWLSPVAQELLRRKEIYFFKRVE